jgi:outer membrane protein OmpA-like peptidoglycan-associated protein
MEYRASGGENHLLIGNFCDNGQTQSYNIMFRPVSQMMLANSAYYYIDQVSVIPMYQLRQEMLMAIVPQFAPEETRLNTTYVLKNIQFKFDSYRLTTSSFRELDQVVDYLFNHPTLKVQLFGHTDDQGNDEYNLKLSRDRARTAAQYFISQGLPVERIEFYGYGKSKPLIPSKTEEARAINRRVEIRFLE